MARSPIIAIVDDDDGVRTSLTSLVRSLGYDTRSYGSAPEFLNDQEIGDPDCMISDIQMPQMTGDQLQAELLAAGRVFPIIFITAFPTEATRSRVMAAGACAYLDKPADGDTIAHYLAAAVEHRCATDTSQPEGQ
ncbi:response regulator transcription factor [Bosea sp. RCC_152_1]|uniref:response regulator transcription factor n=1 Tax=Bosea sp. RCC_152_1 TaxID=3239228 RepID=UPI003523F422